MHGNLKGVSLSAFLSPLLRVRILVLTNSKVNVLVDKNGHARLTDFGLTSIGREDNSTRPPQDMSVAGTTTWAAPEILRGGAVTKEGDIFTFSMVAVEVCATVGAFVGYLSTSDRHSQGILRSLQPTNPLCMTLCLGNALKDQSL